MPRIGKSIEAEDTFIEDAGGLRECVMRSDCLSDAGFLLSYENVLNLIVVMIVQFL